MTFYEDTLIIFKYQKNKYLQNLNFFQMILFLQINKKIVTLLYEKMKRKKNHFRTKLFIP